MRDRGLTQPRRRARLLFCAPLTAVAVAAVLLPGCRGSTAEEKDATRFREHTEKTFIDAITPAADELARATVHEFFDDVVAIRTRDDETKVQAEILEFQPSRTYAKVECAQLGALITEVQKGHKTPFDKGLRVSKAERLRRINGATEYATTTIEIRTAVALLQRIYGSEPPVRQDLINLFLLDHKARPESLAENIAELKKLGFLSPTEEVLTPGARDDQIAYGTRYATELIRFGSYLYDFSGPLRKQVDACEPPLPTD